ncbi:MAG: hypothetical protein WC417_00865 [Candidatus Omnitrophota bacterium]|jgi:hypothetical protein
MPKEDRKVSAVIVKVMLGLFFLGLAIYLLFERQWWRQTWLVLKGSVPLFLALAGVVTLAIAKE